MTTQQGIPEEWRMKLLVQIFPAWLHETNQPLSTINNYASALIADIRNRCGEQRPSAPVAVDTGGEQPGQAHPDAPQSETPQSETPQSDRPQPAAWLAWLAEVRSAAAQVSSLMSLVPQLCAGQLGDGDVTPMLAALIRLCNIQMQCHRVQLDLSPSGAALRYGQPDLPWAMLKLLLTIVEAHPKNIRDWSRVSIETTQDTDRCRSSINVRMAAAYAELAAAECVHSWHENVAILQASGCQLTRTDQGQETCLTVTLNR